LPVVSLQQIPVILPEGGRTVSHAALAVNHRLPEILHRFDSVIPLALQHFPERGTGHGDGIHPSRLQHGQGGALLLHAFDPPSLYTHVLHILLLNRSLHPGRADTWIIRNILIAANIPWITFLHRPRLPDPILRRGKGHFPPPIRGDI